MIYVIISHSVGHYFSLAFIKGKLLFLFWYCILCNWSKNLTGCWKWYHNFLQMVVFDTLNTKHKLCISLPIKKTKKQKQKQKTIQNKEKQKQTNKQKHPYSHFLHHACLHYYTWVPPYPPKSIKYDKFSPFIISSGECPLWINNMIFLFLYQNNSIGHQLFEYLNLTWKTRL